MKKQPPKKKADGKPWVSNNPANPILNYSKKVEKERVRMTSPEEKVKIATKLYKDNPGPAHKSALDRAKAELAASSRKTKNNKTK